MVFHQTARTSLRVDLIAGRLNELEKEIGRRHLICRVASDPFTAGRPSANLPPAVTSGRKSFFMLKPHFTLPTLAVIASVLASAPAQAETLIGLTTLRGLPVLIEFDSEAAVLPQALTLIRGVPFRQQLVAIDVRPATGQLYAIGVRNTSAQLYAIDASSGEATAVGTAFTGLEAGSNVTYGFDFNPGIDRARLISSTGQNLVFNPDTGEVTVATDVFFAVGDANEGETPAVSDIAYDNNIAGQTGQQRGIDLDLDVLVTVANNAGTLGTIGDLGFDFSTVAGYDVSGATNTGYAVATLTRLPLQLLFTIDSTTGAATPIGFPVLGLVPFTGLTTMSAPQPTAN